MIHFVCLIIFYIFCTIEFVVIVSSEILFITHIPVSSSDPHIPDLQSFTVYLFKLYPSLSCMYNRTHTFVY